MHLSQKIKGEKMQLNSKPVYAVAGSLITLLLVFIFKIIFLSNSLVPTTQVSTPENCPPVSEAQYTENYYQDKKSPNLPKSSISQPTLTKQQNTEKAEELINGCNDTCGINLITQFINGNNLTEEDGFNISSDQANKVAELLTSDPSKLSEMENTLRSLKNPSARDSILYVFSRLPDDQVQRVSQALSNSENKSDRIDALSLLESVANTNPDAQNEIKQIIGSESDPDILLTAIKVSHSLNPDSVDSVTQSRLSNLINSSNNDEIRSQALVTKTNIIKHNTDLQSDVQKALTSGSKRFQEAGLQALDNVLGKQKNDVLLSNNELRKSVETIANDPNADPRTRVDALNLIRRHYYNR